jgi:hypothetical protein
MSSRPDTLCFGHRIPPWRRLRRFQIMLGPVDHGRSAPPQSRMCLISARSLECARELIRATWLICITSEPLVCSPLQVNKRRKSQVEKQHFGVKALRIADISGLIAG